jgi:nucleotide-binding universal stress UspA family protein
MKGVTMNGILLATDGSPSARAATASAIDLAAATGWPLRVLTVWRAPLLAGYGYSPPTLLPELAEAEREHALEVAEAAVENAVDADVHATFQLREGDAAEEICRAARELEARVVVVGAHGWGPVQRLLFGSVSTHVLHDAPCPVLVARAGDRDTAQHTPEEHAVALHA